MSNLQKPTFARALFIALLALLLSSLLTATSSAAPWDDLLKKAEETVTDTVDDVLDVDKEPETPQQPQTVQQKPTYQQQADYGMLATHAGNYAGLADACNQSVGAAVRADLEPRAAKVTSMDMMGRFDQLYDYNIKTGSQRCFALEDYRSKYESAMRAVGAEPVTVGVTQVSSPPVKTQSGLPGHKGLVDTLGQYLGKPATDADPTIRGMGYELVQETGSCNYQQSANGIMHNVRLEVTKPKTGSTHNNDGVRVGMTKKDMSCLAEGKRIKLITTGSQSGRGTQGKSVPPDTQIENFQSAFGKADSCAPTGGGASCTWKNPKTLPLVGELVMTSKTGPKGIVTGFFLFAKDAE